MIWLSALATTAMAAIVLSLSARRRGWIDRRPEGELERKPRGDPVPPVGGLAILSGLLVAAAVGDVDLPWVALVAALALGSVDDLRGMRWWLKLGGQCLVAALLVLAARSRPGELGISAPTLFLLALLAQNAINTYDNADGTAGSLACLALWPLAAARGALLGFLPFNLSGELPRARAGGGGVPAAYLGDAGSHLLGVLLAWSPGAWVFLTLPALDLVRLVWVRLARGQAPWVGDRSHLAHRLQARGLPPLAVVAVLCAVAVPPLVARAALPEPSATWLGAAATALGFLAVLGWTPATDRSGRRAC